MVSLLKHVTARAAARTRHAGWLLRYWVLDKHHDTLRPWAFLGAVLLTGVQGVWLALVLIAPEPIAAPARELAVINIWWHLAILLVSALISYALRPKIKHPEPKAPEGPIAEEGAGIVRVYGTEWINQPVWLGWVALGRDPIRKKGGKK